MREIPSRVAWMMAFLILGLLAMAGRLYRLSIAETALWRGQAEENMVRKLPNYGPRGFIYDSKGRTLATSEPAYAVMLTDQDSAHVEKALPALAEVLSGGDPAKARTITDWVRQQVARSKAAERQFEPLLIETNLSPGEVTALMERRPELPGVALKLQSARRYPQGPVAGAVLGYVGAISEELKDPAFADYNADEVVGKDGIELAYERQLRARPGSDSVIVDPLGKRVGGATETPPVPGNNLYLTIDLDLQRVAETALARQMDWIRQRNDPHAKPVRGALVVQNVKTGAILAMVSIPTYDPNWLIGGITEDRWQELQKQPGVLVNQAIKGFAPGSTYKMGTALAGLEAGVLGPYEQIPCPATYWKYGNPKNWNGDQGMTDVARALAISCNPFFFEVGDRLGLDRLSASNAHLGFGQQTGIDLPGESAGSNPSQADYGDDFLPGFAINAAIGQGDVLATPLQLAGYVATIASGGTRYQPYLVQEVRDPDGNLLMQRDPVVAERVPASAQSWKRIQEGMRLTVTSWEGTAHWPLTGFPIPVAAKTGSAETSSGYPHALSVVYAPFDNPEIAIAAIIEGGSTGSWVTPVERRVMAQYFGIHDVIPADVPTYKD